MSLLKAQILIYKFMQKNLSTNNYLGEGVNNSGQVQVYFKVGSKVMVICVSKELYSSSPEFINDKRPVRVIVTSYFIDWQTFKKFSVKKCW